jgi:hypothetical protein
MSKDPAFLFYTSDFLTGTMTMTNEQVGMYIRLLCLQHQKGLLTEKDMMFFCQTYDQDIFEKFIKDENGNYYNQRLKDEADKRNKFTESRRQSRLKCDEDNVRIYLLKDLDSGLIKIGSSVNPLRRYNEITNQTISVSGSSDARNYKLLWYSEPTIRIIEKELHNKYQSKKIEGEWFKLTNLDICELKDEIIKTYVNNKETYVKRTENENEDINKDINKDINNKKDRGVGEDYSEEFLSFWKAYPKRSGSKKAAFDIWKKLGDDLPGIDIILSSIMIQKGWRKNSNGEFRPEWKDPERWLKNRMWESDFETEVKKAIGVRDDFLKCKKCGDKTFKGDLNEAGLCRKCEEVSNV